MGGPSAGNPEKKLSLHKLSRRLSIKLVVTFWYGLMMVLVVTVVLGFLFAVGGSLEREETRQRLLRTVEDNARRMAFEDSVLKIDDTFIRYLNGIYTLVYAEDGALLYGRLPPGVDIAAPFEDGRARRLDIAGAAYEVYDQWVVYEGSPALWLRGVQQIDGSGGAGPLLNAGLFALPLLSALSIGMGYLITRRAFLPIEHIRRAAEDIDGGRDLSLRIELGEGRDELHRLAETFNHMLARLEASFEAEKQFVSDASHELRTPTSVILAQCDDALEQPGSAGGLREALEVVRRQAEKLSRLIAQLLTFARLEQSIESAQLERQDISELLEALCVEIKLVIPGLQAYIQPGVSVLADRDLFTRLVVNLLQNAFRYGGSHVWVRLRREGRSAVLTVKDNGIGIAPEHLPKIWNRFYQVNPARSASENAGVGLGLAICRQVAALHGGEITAASEPGRGSEFRFTLPAL